MATHYIYLPVYDLQLFGLSQKWKKDSAKDIAILSRQSTGVMKIVGRTISRGILKDIPPTATLYVLAHGFSGGRNVTGEEAKARSLLSTYGSNYEYLEKHYPLACHDCLKAGYVIGTKADALEGALDDDISYQKVVHIFSKYVQDRADVMITVEMPGALKIGGTRPNGSTKAYSPGEFAAHLRKEKLPAQLTKLKIFACNTAVIAPNETYSFAEKLYLLLKNDHPNLRVYGYLGATSASYSRRNVTQNATIPTALSQVWNDFHDDKGGYTKKDNKGVRIVKPTTSKVLIWGSSESEFIPAHVLRVEFPGGQRVTSDMTVQENESKPF